MANFSSAQKRSIPRSSSRTTAGFTLIELLIASAIGLIIVGLALTLILGTRTLYTKDVARVSIDDNLRAGLDIINADVRQAGERLPSTTPAIQVLKGASGGPDTLIVRRNLLDNVLNVCQSVSSGTANDLQVTAAAGTSTNTVCSPSNTDLTAWKNYRTTQSGTTGTVRAYLYDPSVRQGEFFDYSAENLAAGTLTRQSGKWTQTYNPVNQPVVYLMEERAYRLDTTSGDLTVTIGNALPALHVIAGITAFNVTAYLLTGTNTFTPVTTDFGTNTTDNWKSVGYIDVSLTGKQTQNNATVSRTLNEQPVPRNVLSK
ncbi:prepilin-type N-terminal cleavage/methylation domain-containing protein (plasmid) [Deinococcus radiomollis]|uniref:PilW family protein n=1 Tax=Deinococcus radiomollis TaxID=468916 RepID=UPI003891F2D1